MSHFPEGLKRGSEIEQLEAGPEIISGRREFLIALFRELNDLRALLLPAERPATVDDYLTPILVYLDGRSDVDDATNENDELRTLNWLRDALDSERSTRLQQSTELATSSASRQAEAMRGLRHHNDQLLDQLGLLLPDKVDAYIGSLQWSAEATDHEKTLVAGNLRAFAAAVRSQSPIPARTEAHGT